MLTAHKMLEKPSGSNNEWKVKYARGVESRCCLEGCGEPIRHPDGRRRYCSADCAAQAKKDYLRARQTKHREAHPDREACRQAFNRAIRAGKIRRATRCERCAVAGYTEGHHTDYSKPFFVEWLCRNCHKNHVASVQQG